MRKRKFLFHTILLSGIIFLMGCQKSNTPPTGTPDIKSTPAVSVPSVSPNTIDYSIQPEAIAMSDKEYPRVDGSTATIPLSTTIYRLATGAAEETAEAKIIHTKTTNSYLRLINKEADLLIVYAPGEEVYKNLEETKTVLNMKPIGKDALVFLTNSSNPVKSLTQKQITDIYSGTITNWFDVGGNNTDIVAFQRPDGSGSQTLMTKLVMGDTPLADGPSVIKPSSMGDIIDEIAKYNNTSNALGYSVYYYTSQMYQLPDMKYIAVDGITPSNETIQKGSYPYINEFYAVIRDDEPVGSNARKIFNWLTSPEGQDIINKSGYVPVQ